MVRSLSVILFFILTPVLHAQQEDALLLYRQGQYNQAVKVCLAELQERKQEPSIRRMDSYTVLGWSYLRLGEYEKALSTAQEARKEVRYDMRLIEIEGEAFYYLGQNTESLALFEEYVSLNKNTLGDRIDSVYYFMGEIFLRLAEYQHADIAFSTAIHYSPQLAQWWARLGYTREQIPDIKGAESAYSKALELMPSLEEARVGLERLEREDSSP